MWIAHLQIRNFRGIRKLDWTPSAGINCLIGPGDSTKTTILDAVELVLNPRANYVGDDTDFYNLNLKKCATATVTLVDLPTSFYSDNRYGLHLRGWNDAAKTVVDEPGEPAQGIVDALSLRVALDPVTLEARWSIFNDRLNKEADPPSLRFKDAREVTTTRLGLYAERHLGFGRQSILNRIGDGSRMTEQLAIASRAARAAFRESNKSVFSVPVDRAQKLGEHFAVRVRKAFVAELDVQGSSITSGGIALHDGDLPLRTLGTGSARLIVSALQHHARHSHVALVDEIEHGLEPHRIARLLKYLTAPPAETDGEVPATVRAPNQIFLTSHSEVVIRELKAEHIQAVRSFDGTTKVLSVLETAGSEDVAQRHLRASPGAFLARRVLVGEGKTECGLLRGLDHCWTQSGRDSFALCGVVAVDGRGVPQAVTMMQHLLALKYDCLALLDSDKPPSPETVAELKEAGGTVLQWPGTCSTDERIFLDVPWSIVRSLVEYASQCHTVNSVLACTNAKCNAAQLPMLLDLALPDHLDSEPLRQAIGATAKDKDWFKTIERSEYIAALIYPCLQQIESKPLAQYLRCLREWVDG